MYKSKTQTNRNLIYFETNSPWIEVFALLQRWQWGSWKPVVVLEKVVTVMMMVTKLLIKVVMVVVMTIKLVMVMTKVLIVMVMMAKAAMMIALTRSYPGSLSCPGSPLASLLLRT